MGIRDRPISPRSPWQNGYLERLIGTLRRECLDHVLNFGGTHLRKILTLYAFLLQSVSSAFIVAQDRLHHARQPVGEWLLRELQLEASR